MTANNAVIIDTGYRPREIFIPLHMRKQRWGAVVAHRRAGKSVACVNDLIDACVRCPKPNPRFGYIAPFYAQAKDIAWMYFKEYGLKIPGAKPHEGELRLDLPNGGRIKLYGADNYDRMRGVYFDGVVMDEPADMPSSAWPEVIRPALSDRQGWALFIGTSKGRNAFYRICEYARTHPKEWYFARLPASETGVLPIEELEDARASMTQEQYDQEYECSFDAAIVGAYYAKEINQAFHEGRVRRITPDPALPVHTAWDLGISDSMVVWMFQVGPEGCRVLDVLEDHGQKIAYYTEWLEDWAQGLNVEWGYDWLPHDARVRDLGTGKTRIETLLELGREPLLAPHLKIDDGIHAVRKELPNMWFDDSARMLEALEALKQYRTEYDDKKMVFNNKPRHDWTSHKADGFRVLSIAYREMVVPKKEEKQTIGPGQVILPGPPTRRGKARMIL